MATRKVRTTTIGFSIGVAAESVGMHPQTLREYERQGLVQPARTDGGTRRYRERELERLRRIQALTELGMSLAAVRHVLGLEDRLGAVVDHVRRLEHALVALGQPLPAPPDGSGLASPGGSGASADAAAGVRPTDATPGSQVVRGRGTVSVEIVHVPRAPRSPRWRNDG